MEVSGTEFFSYSQKIKRNRRILKTVPGRAALAKRKVKANGFETPKKREKKRKKKKKKNSVLGLPFLLVGGYSVKRAWKRSEQG